MEEAPAAPGPDRAVPLGPARADARERLARAGVTVLHEDNHLLVISKPPGLLAQGGPGLPRDVPLLIDAYRREAEQKRGRAFVGLVHRLDRNVSGAMVVAKTSKAASRLSETFRTRGGAVRKVYLAWIAGRPGQAEGTLAHRLRREGKVTREASLQDPEGKEARLDFAVEGRGRQAARVRVELLTGITHQVRAQMAAWGHPLVGDAKYGGPKGTRPALHAVRLAFPHPVGGQVLDVAAAVPADLLRLDHALGIQPPL